MRKKLVVILISSILAASIFGAENFALDFIKKSDITIQDTFSINSKPLWNYSKINNAVEVRLGTEFFAFPKDIGSMGLSTTYSYSQKYCLREEINQFYANSISECIWFDFKLTDYLSLLVDVGAGLQISKIDAISIDQYKIDDYYNALTISLKPILYGRIFSAGPVEVLWNGGLHTKFIVEQDSWLRDYGITAGITVREARK